MIPWSSESANWNAITYKWDDQFFSPNIGTLTFSTTAPNVLKYLLTYVPSASLTLTGKDLTATTGYIITPGVASLTGLSGGNYWLDVTDTWAAYSGNWNAGTSTPAVGVTYTFTIDSANNLVLTPYEPEYPVERQPKFIATVYLA